MFKSGRLAVGPEREPKSIETRRIVKLQRPGYLKKLIQGDDNIHGFRGGGRPGEGLTVAEKGTVGNFGENPLTVKNGGPIS